MSSKTVRAYIEKRNPPPPAPAPVKATVTLTRERFYRALRAASLFQCMDVTRFHLNGVFIELTGVEVNFVATDGPTMGVTTPHANLITGPEKADAILPHADVDALLKILKPSKLNRSTEITLSIEGLAISVSGADVTFVRNGTDAGFPPYNAVVPRRNSSLGAARAALFGVNPRYLERAGQAVRYFGDAESRGVEFQGPADPGAPMRLDFHDPDVGSLTIVIMPMRLP